MSSLRRLGELPTGGLVELLACCVEGEDDDGGQCATHTAATAAAAAVCRSPSMHATGAGPWLGQDCLLTGTRL
jgi:hypothetical protein